MTLEMLLLWGLMATFTLSLSAAGYLVLRPKRSAMVRLKKLPVGSAAMEIPADLGAALAGSPVDPKKSLALRKGMLKTPISMGDASKTQKLLHHAGYRSGTALGTYNLIRMLCMVSLPVVFYLGTLQMHMMPATRFFAVAVLALAGMLMPKLVLRSLARGRQHRLKLSLPDALDLLVVCVEAGMGLNQAIVKVADELEKTHKEISVELKLVNLEIRAGRTRGEALKNLGERTGVDDIIALAAMLIQTDKFGTSVAKSLRVHSDCLRTERIQRAEEAAAKTTIKLIFPLLFCIFPALLVVILGPAFLNLARIFGETIQSTAK
ncbi:MAG TPA: type II secretion system F family protein [Candidatus Polarisedimenticolia bacterium]|nr:type II secretion system F family protein [Candidatus Polarisedimenticolia bacterium]